MPKKTTSPGTPFHHIAMMCRRRESIGAFLIETSSREIFVARS
jgi:hypothetical protein